MKECNTQYPLPIKTPAHANLLGDVYFTVGKRNYFTGYGILLHELPVVTVLFPKSNNNEWTMDTSLSHTSRLIVKLEF